MSIIPKFITQFFSFIKGLISKVSPEVKSFVELGIKLVENIKAFVDSSGADVLTSIIPGELDDEIKMKLRQYLPKLLANLQGLSESLTDQELAEYFEKFNNLEEDAKAILSHGIASAVNNIITDSIGSISQSFITTEVVYKAETEEVKNAD